MFDNIGNRIKVLAVILTLLGIVASFIVGTVFLDFEYVEDKTLRIIIRLFIIVGGSFLPWVSSFLLYGFGQLIENTDKLVNLRIANLKKIVPTTYNAEKVLLKKN